MLDSEEEKLWIQCLGFDTDGVIVAADELHFKAFNMALKKEELPEIGREEFYDKYLASDDKNFFLEYLSEIRQSKPDYNEIEKLVSEKSEIFEQLMTESPPKFYLGVTGSIKKLKKYGIRLFDVTGSLRHEAETHFKRGGIENCFEFTIASEDVVKRKPDPEAYLKALEMLNHTAEVKPSDCIVTEDSCEGILSAKNAGFYTIGVTNTTSAKKLWDVGADVVVREVNIRLYERLLQIKNRPKSRLDLVSSLLKDSMLSHQLYIDKSNEKFVQDLNETMKKKRPIFSSICFALDNVLDFLAKEDRPIKLNR